jgi:hypothetical protein
MSAVAGHAWMQYRAIFESRNGGGSAVLEDVRVTFR